MSFEVKPNSGSIFDADKDGNEARPDMKGKARVGDKAVWVSGWWNTTRSGDAFLALRFEEMTDAQIGKYMPEAAVTRSSSHPPPNRAGTRDNSALIASVQERAKQMAERNKQRLPQSFDDGLPKDEDIPF